MRTGAAGGWGFATRSGWSLGGRVRTSDGGLEGSPASWASAATGQAMLSAAQSDATRTNLLIINLDHEPARGLRLRLA